MARIMTSLRLNIRLVDQAAKELGAKTRTEAVHMALREIVGLKRFKKLMTKNAGKLKFRGERFTAYSNGADFVLIQRFREFELEIWS